MVLCFQLLFDSTVQLEIEAWAGRVGMHELTSSEFGGQMSQLGTRHRAESTGKALY